jgi:hypothetical protein
MTSSKRPRTTDPDNEVEVLHAFKVHTNLHDQYEPLKLELCSDGSDFRVRCTQHGRTTPFHGSWKLGDGDLLTVLWNYQGNERKSKLQHFQKIPHTNAYERINCDSTWKTTLIPWID